MNRHLMRCPRCHNQMKQAESGRVALDVCGYCQGTWVDGGELRSWLKAHGRGLAKLAELLRRKPAQPTNSGMTCRKCEHPLYVQLLGRLEFDSCSTCQGVFFDWRTLERALEQAKEAGIKVGATPHRSTNKEVGVVALDGVAQLLAAIAATASS